jgi:hypothetical protein
VGERRVLTPVRRDSPPPGSECAAIGILTQSSGCHGDPRGERIATIRADYFHWLRSFPLVSDIGRPSESEEIIAVRDAPPCLDAAFWSKRTHELEDQAGRHLTDSEIDRIFDEVSSTIDENLRRFDPLVQYFANYFPDGDPRRIEDERQIAHSVKRDLAWAAVEQAIERVGFFSQLLPWYDRGRWPCSWMGTYPSGHVLVA